MRAPRGSRRTDANNTICLMASQKPAWNQLLGHHTRHPMLLGPAQLRLGSRFAIPPLSNPLLARCALAMPMPYSYIFGTVLHELICIGWTWEHLVKQVMQGKAQRTSHSQPCLAQYPVEPIRIRKKASAVPKSNNGKKWAMTDSLSQMTPIRWAEIGLGRRVMPHLCCAVLRCQLLLTHSHSLDNMRFLFQYLMLCSSFLSMSKVHPLPCSSLPCPP
ncbi:hypothetical protein FSOLCH5_012984 [Fusarium solani]|uniref:Uncharacterized protein n=1 Tax=Fusarium solani TaxID=169388 RepID=A0A9P9I049_FUSSL|nr:uncharacterized protein B0J15DRAFT_238659 [Fusarium solani]KAH7266092.1 hypothetical protein B0J15DRAFT_238659 [Fusarium solani]